MTYCMIVLLSECRVAELNLLETLSNLRPDSQYNDKVTLQQEVIQFLMGLSKRLSLE